MSVNNRDGSLYGVVGTFANVIKWISEAEAEKLKEANPKQITREKGTLPEV